jgi:hypothetical protein
MLRPEERDQTQHDPDRSRDDRDASEDVTRLRAERARSAHTAEGTSEPAAATALHEHEQHQKDREERQQEG